MKQIRVATKTFKPFSSLPFYPLGMKNSFIKHALIAGVTIFTMAWVAVFAQTNIQTNIFNAVQNIMRTVYTDNGAQNGNIIAEINSTANNSYFLQNVWVQTNNPNANLQTVGNVVFGDMNNFAWYPNDNEFNSVLWWLGNHVETTRSSIAWWVNNNIVADAWHSFIGWGWFNTAHAWASTIGWGEYNTINNGYATAYATIAWGRNNAVMGEMSTIGGWGYHIVSKSFATIAWWFQNGADGNYSTIGGGRNNVVNARWSTIAWWDVNNISHLWAAGFIGWWVENWISNLNSAIAGWYRNIIHAASSFIGWGEENIIEAGSINVLGWGRLNTIQDGSENGLISWVKNFINGFANFIGGWNENIIRGNWSSIVWGHNNEIKANRSTIGWGTSNLITGDVRGSTIPGWELNFIMGNNSFVAGKWAKTEHDNTFVWSDGFLMGNRDPTCNIIENIFACTIDPSGSMQLCPTQCLNQSWWPFQSTNSNQFLVYASNGFGINTNNPLYTLDVNGNIRTQGTFVAPSGNQGIAGSLNPPIVLDLMGWDGNPCTMTIEAGIVVATTCPTIGQAPQPLMIVTQAANTSKNLSTSAIRFTITNNGQNDSNITNLYFDTLLQGYTGSADIQIYRNNVSGPNLVGWSLINTVWYDTQVIVPMQNQLVDAGNTVTYIVVIAGTAIDPNEPSQYREISLSGIDFDNVWPGQISANYPIIETY